MLISTYKGRVNIELAMQQAYKVYSFYQSNTVERSIIDISKVFGSFAKLLTAYEKFYPVAVESGLRKVAYVHSNAIMVKNLIDKLREIASKFGVTTEVFLSFEEAKSWIARV